MERVLGIVYKLDETKLRGPDNLPPSFFKNAGTITKSLSKIFTKVKQTGIYPLRWKISKLRPLFKKSKKGDRRSVENYRPVALIDIASKCLENCLFIALYEWVSPLIPDVQHGFRRGRSTLTQLLQYVDSLYRAADTTNLVDSVYLDFSEAFDKIDHDRSHAVRGSEWCAVRYSSNTQRCPARVPSRSSLFLMYSFDFCEKLACDAFTFADDAKLLSIRQRLSPPHVLQHDMQLLHRWSENKKLPFNLEKCHVTSCPVN